MIKETLAWYHHFNNELINKKKIIVKNRVKMPKIGNKSRLESLSRQEYEKMRLIRSPTKKLLNQNSYVRIQLTVK